MKTKLVLFLLILVILLIIAVSARIIYVYNSNNINIKGLKGPIATSSSYISLKIKHNQYSSLIVCPNTWFYDNLRQERWLPLSLQWIYVYTVGRKILNDGYVTLSGSLYYNYRDYAVNKGIVSELSNINISKDTSYVKNGLVNYTQDWEVQKAVIYSLLKQNIPCLYNCEGTVSVGYIDKKGNLAWE